MDWLDFFFGMFVGAAICEDEYENNRDDYYDEEFEQYLFDKKLLGKLK